MSNYKYGEQAVEDFKFAKTRTTKILNDIQGWDTRTTNPENLGPQVCIYLVNAQNQRICLFSAPEETFKETAESAKKYITDVNELAEEVASRFISLDTNLNPIEKQHQEEDLAILATMYLGCTKTYLLNRNLESGRHFFVILYPDGIHWTVRPAISCSQNQLPFPASEVINLTRKIEQIDKKRHPEWFN